MNAYLYTMKATGEIVERKVTLSRHRGSKYAIAVTDSGQRIVVASHARELHNDSMWCSSPQKYVYAEMMLEVLLDRREDYRDRMQSTNSRIAVLRECVREGGL